MTALALPPPGRSPAPHPPPTGPAPRLRVALYSHDTQGLGHVRRNLAIAGALAGVTPRPDVLLVSGAQHARAFRLPPGADAVTLPAFAKSADGSYASRSLSTSLEDLVELRARTIDTALDVFDPDVLVVDKVARGAFGELERALDRIREQGTTRVVLGLRDVLDAPAAARREWVADRSNAAVRRWYDAIWVYGDPRIADPVADCGMPPDVAAIVRHTGYLAPLASSHRDAVTPDVGDRLGDGPYVLCCVGGGQDGAPVAEAFLRAAPPAGHRAVVVTGPFLPDAAREHLVALAAGHPDRVVLGAVEDCRPLLAGAAAVVTMGGYNTIVELLAAGRPTLVVPRERPRLEQRVRAERLAARGVVDVCAATSIDPATVAAWTARAVDAPAPHPGASVDLGGLVRLPALLAELVGDDTRSCCAAS